MAENKTKPTDASVEAYIASRANAQQTADCQDLMALMERVTDDAPVMWGPSIVGYGRYRYAYESGRTGEMPLVGFAIRGRELVVYVMAESEAQKALLQQLGPHRMGEVVPVRQAARRSRHGRARAARGRFGGRGAAAVRLRRVAHASVSRPRGCAGRRRRTMGGTPAEGAPPCPAT